MEPEEISVVLARASLLHSQLCEAILSFPDPSPPHSSPPLPSLDHASELRSLVSIRDALHSLREHLDSLQALHLQQRAERDFGLAEIEESRRIFLKCLREHNGRELEVIQEAFTFAGGKSSEEKNNEDEVGSMPLHHTLTSHSHLKANGEGKRFYTKEGWRSYEVGGDIGEDEDGEDDEDGERGDQEKEGRGYDEEEEDLGLQYPSEISRGFPANALLSITKDVFLRVRKSVGGSITLMRMASMALEFAKKSMGFFGKITQKANENARVPCSKGILVVVATIVLLSLTSSEDGKRKKSLVSRHIHRARQSRRFNHIASSAASSSSSSLRDERLRRFKDEYDEEEDCVLRNCFVRERVELPFFKASHIPDVLHGRG